MSLKGELLLIGGGGHCKAVIDVIEKTQAWNILGIIERANSGIQSVCGYPVLGDDDDLWRFYSPGRFALITVGQIKSANLRKILFAKAQHIGFQFPAILSPLANISNTAKILDGTVIMHFAHIGPDVSIGSNTIINTGAIIEHDCSIGNHCHISTHTTVNGNVSIHDQVFLGSGSICKEGITVEQDAVIGMGVCVRKNIASHTVFYGQNLL